MERCGHCPVDRGAACLATIRKRRRYCELVDPANPNAEQREAYARHLRGEPHAQAVPVETPGILTRIATAATAAVNFVAGGFEVLDQADVDDRLAVCSGCDQRTPGGLCAGCGCWLTAKARLPREVCPLGKWPIAPPSAPAP